MSKIAVTEAARAIIYACGIGGYGPELKDDHPLVVKAIAAVQSAVDAEVERLATIVDPMPKTADGVTLQYGMTVWYRGQDGWTSTTVMQIEDTTFVGDGEKWGETFGHRLKAANCYSDRPSSETGEKTNAT